MKIALKYGLLITVGIIAWVVIVHLLVPNPQSPVHILGPLVFFNLLEITGIYFGVGARRRESGHKLQFKTGLKTGMAVALVYGIASCLFFLVEIAVLGAKIMAAEPGAMTRPIWHFAITAFAGQFLGAIILGLIYSTVIAFLFATRREIG